MQHTFQVARNHFALHKTGLFHGLAVPKQPRFFAETHDIMFSRPTVAAPAEAPVVLEATCIVCPLCAQSFKRDPDGQRPMSVSCGHSFCSDCVDALLLVPEPVCPVCSSEITQDTVFNVGLADFSEELALQEAMKNGLEECGDISVSAASSSLSPSSDTHHSLSTTALKRSRVSDDTTRGDGVPHSFPDVATAAAHLTAAARQLHGKLDTVSAMKTRLSAQADTSLAAFYAKLDTIQAALTKFKLDVTRAVTDVKAGHDKVLDAEKDAIEISCGQLLATAALCQSAVGSRSQSELALISADHAAKLLPLVDKPVPSAYVSIDCDPSAVITALNSSGHVVDSDIDGVRSVCTLVPTGFLLHDLRNVIKIECLNARGEPFVQFSEDDVLVDIRGVSGDGSSAALRTSVSLPSPGRVVIDYFVSSPAVASVEALVSIHGVVVRNKTIVIHPLSGCEVRGTHLRTHRIQTGRANIGLLINPAGTEMFVSNETDHCIAVYDLTKEDCPLVRELGRLDDDADADHRQFGCPSRMAWSKNGTIIVAEYANRRLQEITVEGTFVKFFQVADFVFAIAAREDLVCIALHAHSHEDNRVKLYDYNTAALVRSFAGYGEELGCLKNAAGVRFSLDGSEIVVAEGDRRRLMVFNTSTGEFVKAIGEGEFGSAADVDFGAGNKVIGLNCYGHCLLVFDGHSNTLLSSFGKQGHDSGEFQYPTSIAVWNHLLYVLDNNSSRVQVFE
jgi:DNA-binding beta-propeller fold protein YncE